tara:strand:+ start:446 stop:775 length:330 start_codon:yes stop_codon:yes gene_type:complete
MAGRKVYDLNRLKKTYPLRRRRPAYSVVDSSYNETATIECNSVTTFPITYTFNNTYSSIPVCIASVENLKTSVFITNLSVTTVSLNIASRIPENTNIKIHLQVYADQGA